jgi:hypothetical protein
MQGWNKKILSSFPPQVGRGGGLSMILEIFSETKHAMTCY